MLNSEYHLWSEPNLTPADAGAIATYLRQSFGNWAGEVDAEDVAAQR